MTAPPESPLPASMDVDGAVFEAASMLDPEARRAFLERYFHDDPEGLTRMTVLLDVSGESAAFFLEASQRRGALADEILADIPAEADEAGPPAAEDIGSSIGPYRLVARIGEGGCGVVYEAEQEHPVRRTVALKIIRLGMDTERVIARFEAERQALAMMDHPNIARVYDAGATAKGRPYFVMERVGGERISTFCDREHLGTEARIRLFVRVCHAIQHAHQKGVIHRDIKPSNVLVSPAEPEPEPKVIDFGIAKATDRREADLRSPRTVADQLLGTPPYMSPEQVDMSGTDVDTRTDVYSLGALLYELLCGRAPFDDRSLSTAGISGMRRTILEDDPPLPSRRIAGLPPDEQKTVAAHRGTDPDRLVSRLRGDLDGIVAKAMAKDRNLRYQTVNALAADLGRFLANQPVLARPPGRLYLLGKFVRRNRAVCALAAAVGLSLVAGMSASTFLYLRERDARAEQNRLRVDAEAARSVESKLRHQAQARANVSQAAVLLSEGRIEEADALLQQHTLMTIEPSREAAGVFRELGNWNAFYERWDRAVQYYNLLNLANRLDPPSEIVEQCEVIAISSALLAHGDIAGYDAFRHEMLELYLPARTSHQAEHLLQACLLTPADRWIMDHLVEVAEVCVNGTPDAPHRLYPDWEAFAMALYHHRLGNAGETLKWGRKCLSYPAETNVKSGEARLAATHCLMAVAEFRLGDTATAEKELRGAREQIVKGRQATLSGTPSLTGEWYTWVIARLLFSEARLLIPDIPALEIERAEVAATR